MSDIDVIMPQMGESIAEGTLTRWVRKLGEPIERDDDLFEISTDKVDAEIPSPITGVLTEILVQEGETVEVNTVVARMRAGNAAPADGPAGPDAPDDAPAETAAPEPAATTAAPAPDASADTRPESREGRLKVRSTPLVRKIAAEHGVDIALVTGTGSAGRVTRADIMRYIETGDAFDSAGEASEETLPATVASDQDEAGGKVPAKVAAGAAIAAPAPAFAPTPAPASAPAQKGPRIVVGPDDRVEDMSRVRLRTMQHMVMSKAVSAHVTSVSEVDFERVVNLRAKMKPSFAERGVKLSYGPFVYRAVVEALKQYPILNASVRGTQVVYRGNINLGIAVAINNGSELIVPVIKKADRLSLMGLAQEANELAEKARGKSLGFADIEGGTFTITNVGVFGNLFGTPIINQPQVAILGTGAIEKRPVVVQDSLGADAIAIRHRAYFGLSYDHRVVDGAMAAFFLNAITDYLEDFPDETG